MRWLSIPLAALLAVGALPWCAAWMWRTWLAAAGPPQDAAWLAGGAAIALALVWWKRPNWLVHTTVHELCHAVMCLLLVVRVRDFQVSDGSGGAVVHDRTDWPRSTLIAIAPYTLPLLLAPALLAQDLLAPGAGRQTASAAVGFLAVHHLHALWHNLRLNFLGSQGDLARVGRLLSLVLIALALCGVAGWTVRTMWVT